MDKNFGFVILCPERNIGGLKNTINSIKHSYSNSSCVCVVGDDANTEEFKEMNNLCETHKGKNTITSLINLT